MITLIAAAAALGFAGSLHCVGMCGPLVSIVHGGAQGKSMKWWGNQGLYHFGRIGVYALFGVLTGFLGKSLSAMGLQRWLALISGVVLLVMILFPFFSKKKFVVGNQLFQKVSSRFSQFLQKKNPSKYLALGVINGFLPCGLVYAAMAASLSGGSIMGSVLFMVIFGVATSPALVAVAGLSNFLRSRIKAKSLSYMRLAFMLLAVLFILRGANLGIPYLSPKMKVEKCEMDCCKGKH
ncbi:MAG: sulfite exporter TauE/SafE family protein [Flavobacteriales bacterium]